jgi:hypothetical protein
MISGDDLRWHLTRYIPISEHPNAHTYSRFPSTVPLACTGDLQELQIRPLLPQLLRRGRDKRANGVDPTLRDLDAIFLLELLADLRDGKIDPFGDNLVFHDREHHVDGEE